LAVATSAIVAGVKSMNETSGEAGCYNDGDEPAVVD
jgi:hypothetical protein